MWIYVGILSAIGLLALLSLSLSKNSTSLRAAVVVPAVLILVVFIGFRDRVGADWSAYDNIFNIYERVDLRDVLTTTPIEPLYAVLNYAAHLVGGDIHLVNLACAIIMLVGLVRFAFLIDLDATLLLFLSTPYLLFVVGMGYTRQAVAIGLGFAALGYWIRGKRKKFYAAAILAVGFHYSALFIFLLVWIKSWKQGLSVILLALIIGYFLLPAIFPSYFALYILNTESLHSSGVWFRLAIVLIGVAAVVLQRRQWQKDQDAFLLLVNGSIIAICLVPLAVIASTLADRICLYLFFIYLVSFARAIPFARHELRFVATASIFYVTYACFFLWFATSSYAADYWIPYHSSLLNYISAM